MTGRASPSATEDIGYYDGSYGAFNDGYWGTDGASTTPMASALGIVTTATIFVVMPAMALPGYRFTEAVRSAITSRRGLKLCLVSLSIR